MAGGRPGGDDERVAHQLPGTETTLRLLAALVSDPLAAGEAEPWAGRLRTLAAEIGGYLAKAGACSAETVPLQVLLGWRTRLDEALVALQESAPEEWAEWRLPGTWLDGLLRFRSIVSHVVGKAYWDEAEQVAYGDIDVARYLWGAR